MYLLILYIIFAPVDTPLKYKICHQALRRIALAHVGIPKLFILWTIKIKLNRNRFIVSAIKTSQKPLSMKILITNLYI